MGFIHGIISPIMFFLVYYVYNRLHRRRVYSFLGILKIYPIVSFWWFIIVSCNFRFPPSMGFFSEVLSIYSMFSFEVGLLYFFLIPVLFVGGIYRVYFFCFSSHGDKTESYLLEGKFFDFNLYSLSVSICIFYPIFYVNFSFWSISYFNISLWS
jgi:NADH:ubiquinone oxidoreductase subunit 4 (subunit M)